MHRKMGFAQAILIFSTIGLCSSGTIDFCGFSVGSNSVVFVKIEPICLSARLNLIAAFPALAENPVVFDGFSKNIGGWRRFYQY